MQVQLRAQLNDQIDKILSVYIAGVLELLETKFGRAE